MRKDYKLKLNELKIPKEYWHYPKIKNGKYKMESIVDEKEKEICNKIIEIAEAEIGVRGD
jgi:hypothetical protein